MGEKTMPDASGALQAISDILSELNNTQNSERTLHNIIHRLVHTLNIKTCAVVELNPETEFLEIRKSHNLSYRFCKSYRKVIDNPLLSALIWQGESISIPDSKYALRVVEHLRLEHEFVSAYVTPLSSKQQPLGFLYVDSEELNYFTAERKEIVNIFAKTISACLFLDRLNTELKTLNIADEETGIMRFEHCLPYLKENFHRSMRMNESYSFLILDIEKYSNLLAMYGLDTVKTVLQEAAGRVKLQLRKYDTICRFGADEFLVSLPAVKREDALKVAQKITQTFGDSPFSKQQLDIRVAIGIATFPDNAQSFNGLLTAVKNALYEAKRKDSQPKISTTETKYE